MANNVFVDGRPVEIERKYLIMIPDMSIVMAQENYSSSRIEQMYLCSEDKYAGDRIRKREYTDGCKFYRTHKEDINGLSRFETEEEITADEYECLSAKKLCGTRIIKKVRHCFDCSGLTFELDIYDFWNDKATLEVGLTSEEQEVSLPDFIGVIEDVTGDKAYSNFALASLGDENGHSATPF